MCRPLKVKSKLRQQQEENRFVKNSARITREYERVRFDKEDEYVAEYKDQHSKHPKMKDYPVTVCSTLCLPLKRKPT